MSTQLCEGLAASTSLDENMIFDGIRHLKTQRLELHQSLDDYVKVRSNLQFKVDQEISKNEEQKQISSKMQETLKIAENKVELACEDGQNFQKEADAKRQSVEQLLSAIVKEDERQNEWQSQWEDDTKKLSEKFMNAAELYGRDSLHIELESVHSQCAAKTEALKYLEDKLASTATELNNLRKKSGYLDEEGQFLSSAQAAELHTALDAEKKDIVSLENEIYLLRQEEASFVTD